MSAPDPRDAALEWIALALAEELPAIYTDEIDDAARILNALAEDYDVPTEELIRWIHAPDSRITAANWVRYCVERAGRSALS